MPMNGMVYTDMVDVEDIRRHGRHGLTPKQLCRWDKPDLNGPVLWLLACHAQGKE